MKNNKIKKNTFMQGAFIATFGIVLSKILGMIYVIPFYSIVGEQGGALYGYAYNIYSIFLSISTAGIPLAISSITSEYNTLGQYSAKEKAFKIAKKYLSIVGIACFIVLFIFAKEIAYLIIGDITGGNSIEDITFVIRIISFSILIVPTLSVYRGYLQGHKIITPTSVSQVLEQIIRVTIIIIGSFLAIKVFDLPLRYAVGTALFGATIGSLFSYLYLVRVRNKNKKDLKVDVREKEEEVNINSKMILKKILLCAFPFILCDVCKSLYNSVDTFFVVKTMVGLGYTVDVAESVMSVISTWGNKLNMIVIAIGTGFAVSLIPNLTSSLVKKDNKDVEKKINQTYQTLSYFTLPMTLGLSFLSVPVWNIFYGASTYGPIVFRFSIIVAFVTVLLSSSQIISLGLKEYKILIPSIILGLILNAVLDVPLMLLFDKLGSYAFYGATLSTCLGHILTILIIITQIKKKYNISLKDTVKNMFLSLINTLIMLFVLYLLSYIIPLDNPNRFMSILITIVYAIIGATTYIFTTYKTKLLENVFGKGILEKILVKIKNKIKLSN